MPETRETLSAPFREHKNQPESISKLFKSNRNQKQQSNEPYSNSFKMLNNYSLFYAIPTFYYFIYTIHVLTVLHYIIIQPFK